MLFFYGSRQYGQSKADVRYRVCEACGQSGHLRSYDTARFLHLYWIPLIPAGHQRIMDLCPHCKQCRTVTPGKYRAFQKDSVENVFTQLKKKPNDAAVLADGLQTLAKHQEEELFDKLVETYKGTRADNADVQMAVANGYFQLGRFEEAAATAREAATSGAGEPADELIDSALTYAQNKKNDTRAPSSFRIPIITPYLVPLLIIFGILGSQVFQGFSAGRNREVWLVNGTQVAYTVRLDESTYQLSPYSSKPIGISMGEHTLTVTDRWQPIEPISFQYQVPFWKRMGDDKVLVLNPDRMAFLIQESVPYISVSSSKTAESNYTYFYGENWYELEDIAAAFDVLPENSDMPTGMDIMFKKQLSLYEPESYRDALQALDNNAPAELLNRFAEQVLLYHPESQEISLMLSIASGTNSIESMDLMSPALSHRPVLVEWHRSYQTNLQRTKAEHDLEAEYTELVNNEPEVPMLKYLLGRVMEDEEQSNAMFLASEAGNGSQGYGYHAIAYDLLQNGHYQKAFELAEKAIERSSDNNTFDTTYTECLLATLEYETLLQKVRKKRVNDSGNGNLADLEIRYLSLLKRTEEAQKVENEYIFNCSEWMAPEVQQQWTDYFQATRYYVAGDIDGYMQSLEKATPGEVEYEKTLRNGNIQEALDLLKEEKNTDYTAYLILYCSAMHQEQATVATTALNEALSLLSNQEELSDILEGETALPPSELIIYGLMPDEKKLVACVLAYQHPQQKDAYLKIAKNCNYNPFFPQHLINSWIQ